MYADAGSGCKEGLQTGHELSGTFPRWKRVLDLVLIGATAVLWLPLMLLLIWVIKLISPGPAFYRQQRVGLQGVSFMILKFRSMKVNAETQAHERHVERLIAEDTPMTKLDSNDERLIPLGQFFRATGLDELPQIFNVLRGEMSLVGPRPCTIAEYRRYKDWQRMRVNAPPGMTGYWQVHGKNRTTFSQMIAMDVQYGKMMSLRLDLAIIFKTFSVVVQEALGCMRGNLLTQKEKQPVRTGNVTPQLSNISVEK
jgi:lipopolysaccharide/colanic/teichoic acid biosynthesis glycosyltransferase